MKVILACEESQAVCKEFIDLHGGQLKVESKAGEGSDFKFTLPHMPYYASKMA